MTMPRFARSAVECGASSHRFAPQEDQAFSSPVVPRMTAARRSAGARDLARKFRCRAVGACLQAIRIARKRAPTAHFPARNFRRCSRARIVPRPRSRAGRVLDRGGRVRRPPDGATALAARDARAGAIGLGSAGGKSGVAASLCHRSPKRPRPPAPAAGPARMSHAFARDMQAGGKRGRDTPVAPLRDGGLALLVARFPKSDGLLGGWHPIT